MSKKSRPFSIYLLKQGYDATNALKDDHELDAAVQADNLPPDASLFVLDSDPREPWWKKYFSVQKNLHQVTKGALVFLPVGNRCFALSFGHVFHNLKDIAYEYDFGLRVTLNSLDPKELKSADMVEPGAARRKRTQVPIATELTYLDFDSNSEIIKSLTGKVKKEYEPLFKNATGSSSLKVSLKLEPAEIAQVCETLLGLYESDAYKETFPNIQNIAPVKDPVIVAELDARLLTAFRNQDEDLFLSIPDIIDYRDNTCCVFTGGEGESEVYPDISLDQFYEYLGDGFNFNAVSLEDLKNFRMVLTDIDGAKGKGFSIYRSLIFDAQLGGADVMYHLCEGDWYKVEKSYSDQLKSYLDGKCEDTDLCPYDHDKVEDGKQVYSEGNYNAAVPGWEARFICLDQTDISPTGSTAIEPCDLYSVVGDADVVGGHRAVFHHIKISTRSSHLSHLFNQGVNSVELIELESAARDKMKALVRDNIGTNDEDTYLAPLDTFDFKVVFGVITRKHKNGKSDNLPLFSKMSLMRNMRVLDLMKVKSALSFIDDQSAVKAAYSKHPEIIVEVRAGTGGKNCVQPVAGQGFPETDIKRCPKAVSESPLGSQFRLRVKQSDDGTLSSYFKWPFEAVQQ